MPNPIATHCINIGLAVLLLVVVVDDRNKNTRKLSVQCMTNTATITHTAAMALSVTFSRTVRDGTFCGACISRPGGGDEDVGDVGNNCDTGGSGCCDDDVANDGSVDATRA
jgi:hypothetical protein